MIEVKCSKCGYNKKFTALLFSISECPNCGSKDIVINKEI